MTLIESGVFKGKFTFCKVKPQKLYGRRQDCRMLLFEICAKRYVYLRHQETGGDGLPLSSTETPATPTS